jgi:hypothetical protein
MPGARTPLWTHAGVADVGPAHWAGCLLLFLPWTVVFTASCTLAFGAQYRGCRLRVAFFTIDDVVSPISISPARFESGQPDAPSGCLPTNRPEMYAAAFEHFVDSGCMAPSGSEAATKWHLQLLQRLRSEHVAPRHSQRPQLLFRHSLPSAKLIPACRISTRRRQIRRGPLSRRHSKIAGSATCSTYHDLTGCVPARSAYIEYVMECDRKGTRAWSQATLRSSTAMEVEASRFPAARRSTSRPQLSQRLRMRCANSSLGRTERSRSWRRSRT